MNKNKWLFLSGLSRDKRYWLDFPEKFKKKFNVEIINEDLPGFGTYESIRTPTNVEKNAQLVKKSIKSKAEGSPINIIAFSFGAMVAMEIARSKKIIVKNLILINTSSRHTKWHKRLKPEACLLCASFPLKKSDQREEKLYDLTTKINKQNNLLKNKFVNLSTEQKSSPLNAIKQLIAATKYKAPEKLGKHTKPYIIVSKQDNFTDQSCSKHLANHFQAPLFINHKSGHDIILDDPNWLLTTCEKIINEF